MNVIGALSGTSMDGLDIGWVELQQQKPQLRAFATLPWPDAVAGLWHKIQKQTPSVEELARLDRLTALAFAEAISLQMHAWQLSPNDVAAIGFHGQTLAHGGQDVPNWSVQLGHASTLAAETGIPVVAGFRQDDIANGGQGAPLAPLLHRALLPRRQETMAVLNLGGIANLSLLLPEKTLGLDTGPGNGLLDDWYRRHHPHDPYGWDREGRWADSGKVLPELLQQLLSDLWFRTPAPRSACRQDFSMHWLEQHLLQAVQGNEKPEDIQATLVALTAQTVVNALQKYAPQCRFLWVAGGGVHNQALMQALSERLEQALPELTLEPARLAGLDADGLEAQLFAWLAACRLQNRPLDLSCITGARGPRLLGQIHLPPDHPPA